MAEGKQVKVDLTFNADVTAAKKAMQNLMQDINNLTSGSLKNSPIGGLNNDLLKASQAANQLKQNLSTAFNVKTGNLDLVKFNASMKSAGLSLKQYQDSLMALGPAGAQSFAQLSMAIMRADAPLARVNSKLNEFTTSLKNTAKWQLSSSILHGLMGSINQAYSYAQNLNASLNDIRIVTGASADEMARFAETANKAAKSLSTSTKTYTDAALIFYQQGLGDAEVKERTDAVIKMANVTKDSAAEVSSYMTAIWNNFDDGSKSLEHYADVMTALGAATASSTAEIADGLEKFASIGKTIGLSYDYATSALATIVAQTRQSADTVGTGLRTIFSRLQGLSLGETLEDGVDLNKYSKALSAVGVSVLDATGNMRDMDTILDSLADKWSNLSAAQKTALAQTVGGVRQYTTLISLMDNWDSMETNLNTAKNSSGALQDQANIYAESWEAAKNRVRASAEAIYASLINDKFFISLNNGFSGFLDQINNVIDGLGGLKGVLMSLTPIITSLFRGQINGGIRSALTSFKALLPSGRRDQDATRAEAVQRTATAYDNLSNQEGHAMATHSRNTASLQQAYYNNQRNMSNEQRQLAQQKITQYNEVFGKRVGEAGKRGDTAAENIANTQRTTRRAMARLMAPHQAIIDKEKQVTEEWQKDPKNQRMYNLANRGNKLKSRNKSAVASREAQLQAKLNADVGSQERRDKARTVAAKVQKAQSAQTKLLQKSQSLGFQDAAAKAIQTKINVDTKDIDKAKQQLRDLIATIEKAATENNIDLEASGMQATLDALKQKADDANASIEELRAAAQGLDANADMASAQADSAQEQGEEDDPDDTGFEQAARDAGMDDDKVKQVSQETRQGGEESGAAILEGAVAANEAKGAMEAFREEIEKAGQVDVDFASGFTAAASAVTALGTTISSVMGLMDVWQDDSMSLGEKLSTTFMTGGAALLSFSSAFSGANAQLLKGIPAALASALGFKTAGDSAERAGQDAAKSSPGFLAAGLAALKSGLTAMAGWLPLIGLFAAIVLAVVAIVAFFAAMSNAANANAKAIAELEAENEKLRGSIDAAGAAMNTLEGDLQSLSAVMHDTSLSYEEQLSKINEITNAYGVQASAIDVLTGNYAGLESEMKAALLAREGALVTNLEDYQQQVYENSDELLDRYRDSDKYNAIQGFEGLLGVDKTASFDQGFQINGKTTAADAFAPYNNINKTEVSMREAWQKYSGQAGNELTDDQWERIQPMLKKYGFITQNEDGTWSEHLELMLDKNGNYTADMNRLLKEMEDDGYAADDYDEIKDYLNQRKKDAKSGHAALESALTINANNTNDEGKAWEALLSQEGAAEKYGLRWDSETQSVQLVNGELTGANYASLYEDIGNNAAFADYGFDESSFTGKMISAAELSGADIMASAEEKIKRANLMSSIISSDDFTFMTDTHTRDYEELLKFRRKDTEGNTTSLLESSFDDAMEAAKYLSGFQEYQEAGMQMQAIGELATQAGQIHGKGNAEKATEYRDEIYKEIQSQIASGTIDIDTALRLSPSSIVVTTNGSEINVEIPPEAIKLAETKAAKELQLEVRTNIDAIYDVATKDTLNYEDIKALQESEYFKDNPEDAVRFASQSQAQRQLELDRAKEESYIKEAEANRQLVEQLQAEQARLQTDADSVMNQAIADFGADGASREALFNLKAFQDKGYGSDKIQELQQMDAQGLYQFARGEMEELQKKKAGLEQQQSDLLADMGYATIEEAQAAANKMEDGDDKDTLLQQIQDYEGNAVKLENTTTAYEEYEGLLSGVIQAEQELLSVSSQLKIAQGDQAALDWWATYGAEITKATNAADSFSKAIGKKGQLSADDLAYLEAYDESGKALDNYQNMSSQEWDKYAMESATAYYDELYAYYDGDVAKQIEILQLKQQAQQQYYDSVAEMANQAAEVQQEKWDEAKNAASEAMSSSSDMMTGNFTFTGIEQLKQDMLDAGVATERVTELINELTNAGDDKGQIKAAMIAASEAALAKLGTLHEEKQEYTALVTKLDTSPIEPVVLPTEVKTEEVDDTTVQQKRTIWQSPISPVFETPEDEAVVTAIEGWGTDSQVVTFVKPDGTVVTDEIQSWSLDDQTITFTTANGDKVTQEIDSWETNGQSVTFTAVDGTKITQEIDGWNTDGQTVTFTTVNGGKVTDTIESWNTDGQSVTFETVNGAKVTSTIASWNLNGQSVTFKTVDGSTVTSTIASWNLGEQAVTIKTVDGSTVTTTITGWSLDNKTLKITTADGTVVEKKIESWALDEQNLTIKTANGDTVTTMINGFNLDKQTMTLTLSNGETIKSDIAGWSITNDKLTVKLANGVETTIAGDVAGWTTLSNGNVKVTFKDGTSQELSADLANMDLEVDVDVKFNLGAAAYEQWFTKQMNRISQDTLEKVNLDVANNSISSLLDKFDLDDELWDFNGNWADHDYETTLMAMLIESIGSMDASELTPEIQAGIADMISILEQGMASTDDQTREMATMLYQGLAAGLKDCDVDWDAILGAAGLSAEVIASFKEALGIHSPSALTKALAPWLFEGLRVGIAEADANFDIAPLEGVRSVIASKFQDAMRNALSDGHLDLNEIPGLDENFVAHYNNIMAMEGETEAEKYEAYKTQIGDKAVEDYIAQKGQEAYDNAVHRNNVNGIRNRDRAMVMFDDDGQIVSQPIKPLPRIDPDKARTDAIAAATADQAALDKIRAEAIANFETEFYTQLESTVGKWQQDYIVNKKWNDDDSYSNTQKAILNGAVEAALKEGGWANIDDAMADGGEKFLSLVQANIDKSGKDLEIEISDTWNKLQDIWVEGLNKMYAAEQEIAQKTYELWKKTFTAIANARLGLLEGKSIMESMFGKPEEIASIIETYLNKGMSMDEIMNMLYNRNAQIDFDPWDAESYHNSGAWKYVNRDANGNYTDTTTAQYNANLRTDLTNLVSTELADVVGESLSQTKIDEWANSGDHTKLALLDYLSTKGVVQKNTAEDGSISYSATGNKLSDELISGIVDMMMQSYKATSQAEVNSYIAEAASTQRTQQYERADKARQEGEAYINKQQASFDVVSKAREAMLKGEDLKYALTAEEQKQLLEVTNQSDLAAVSLGDLDSASTTLTNTMIACAQQLGVAMGMIERGEAMGFRIDPTTGAVTVTRARTAAEISAAAAPGLAQLGVEERDGKYYEIGSNTEITAESDRAGWDAIQEVIRTASSEGVEIALSGNKSNNTGDVLDNAGAGNKEAIQLQYAQAAGFASLQEQDDYIAMMEAAGKDTTNYSDGGMLTAEEIMNRSATDEIDTLEEAIDLQREYANQLALMEQGLAELNQNGKEWLKTLKSENKSMAEKAKILPQLKKSYQKILNLSDKFVNDEKNRDFFLDPKNLELAQKAAEKAGKEGQAALDELQARAVTFGKKAEELNTIVGETGKTVSELATALSQLSKYDIGEVLTGSDASWADAYWDHVVETAVAGGASLGDAIAQANADLGTLGIDVEPGFEVVKENVPAETLKTDYVLTGTDSFDIINPDGTVTTVTGDNFEQVTSGLSGTVPITYIKGKNGSKLSTTSKNTAPVTGGENVYTKGAEKPGGGGRGGGGGGSRRRYLAKAKPEDHKERYHEINNALDEVTDALERLNKQQDRAWGAERLKSMQAESAELKKQRDLIRDKIDEAQDYLEQDLAEAALHGWTFDENNNVSNYEDNWDRLLAVYNGKIEEYNNMSIAEQEAIDKQFEETNDKYYEAKAKGDAAAMDKYDDYINPDTGIAFGSYEEYLKYHYLDEPTAALEQVEETMDELEQLGIDYDDVLNSLYDNFIEQVQTKWDTANEIADANIEYLEHKISRLEDNAYKAAETIGLMSDKMDYTQDKFNAATTALDDLLKGYDSAWSAEAIMAGQVTAEDLAGAGMDANAVEMVQSIMSELMNLEQEMTDTLIESFESMTEAFDEFNEDLDRYISTIEHAQSITSTYRNIIDLTGKSMSGFSTELLKAFNSATIDQAKANMKSNKTKYDTVQAEYDEAYQQYLNAQTLHAQGKLNDAALKAAKEAFEATQENLNEAQEAYVASWEAALQAVADAYTSTMEGVMDEIGKNLTNGLAGGLDALQERMDRMKTKDSNYVDDYEKIYQLTKLTRDLETQIDKTSNVRAQKELLKFQKEINGILQSDKKLSEYDIDYLQKKYDLKLAEIALEDAQNAKSQVTMRRDSEGNYNYVYTADENAVAEAEAEYATKLYEMQKANDEYITSLSDSIVSLKVEMRDALLALDPSQFASEEEFNAAVEEIIAFYTEQMSYHQEQLETVLGNNKDLYEQDMVWYNKYANYKMADAASFIDSWNETLLAQATGFETIDELFETFFSQAEVAQSESVTAYRNYVDAINAINAEAGHPTETLAQSLTEDIEAMTDQAEQAATDMKEHAETIVGEITSIGQAIEEMANKFGVEIVNMAKQTDLLVAALTDMLEIMGRAGDIELEEGLLADIEARRQAREQEYASQSFDTGGYTGAWGPEGKLAWLHQKELVLNAADTENILASVGILRQIANTIDLNALTSAGGFISLMSSGISGNRETLQQEVHIEASFPAVTDKNQIEDAFTDLVNLAAQYANRK